MIAIIGAMPEEINAIKEIMTKKVTEVFSKINFTKGIINDTECVVALSGVGKVNAAVCTQAAIMKYSPNIIINTGVAGALKESVKIGDIVLADFVMQHDIDTTAIGDVRALISSLNIVKIPCDNFTNKKITDLAKELNIPIHVGTVASGDQFICSKEKLLNIRDEFNAAACEMEAGSIGQVCYMNGVPFVVLKIISDNASEGSHSEYGKFKYLVAHKTTNLISHLVSKI